MKEGSSVHLKGIIVGQDGQQLILDDGTGRIPVRAPHDARAQGGTGSAVTLIGTVSSAGGVKFIAAGILRRTENTRWIKVHRSEAERWQRVPQGQEKDAGQEPPAGPPQKERDGGTENARERILSLVKRLDSGAGASISEIVQQSGIAGGKAFVDELLREGELFEMGPGRVKVLRDER